MLKSKSVGLILLIVFLLAIAIIANVWKNTLTVKNIEVGGNFIVSSNEIKQLSNIKNGSLLYNTDLSLIEKNISSHHYIKNVIVERNLPSTISITITERFPIAIFNSKELLYVDEEGILLPKAVSKKIIDLPIITVLDANQICNAGTKLNRSDEIEAIQFLYALKKANRTLYHSISEIQLKNGADIIMYSTENGFPIVYGRGDTAMKIAMLEKFWNEIIITKGTNNLQYIDLRYKEQIIAKWNEQKSTLKM